MVPRSQPFLPWKLLSSLPLLQKPDLPCGGLGRLISEFQDSQGYTGKHHLEKQNKTKTKQEKKAPLSKKPQIPLLGMANGHKPSSLCEASSLAQLCPCSDQGQLLGLIPGFSAHFPSWWE